MTEAFVDTALNLTTADFGESFNIGTGQKTTIGEVAAHGPRPVRHRQPSPRSRCPNAPGTCKTGTPTSTRRGPAWGGSRGRRFRDGLQRTVDWYRGLPDKAKYHQSSKKFGLDTRLQRHRDHRLLQGQPGDPDHVRAAQGDVHQAEHRLRDHLRQRLQPRRHRGGDPRASRATTAACSASATRGISARSRRSAAAWRSPPRTPASCSTATCRTRPS